MNSETLGKILLVSGAAVMILGAVLMLFGRFPLPGKLPGDIIIKKQEFSFYFPLGTSILLSLLLSSVFFLINYLKK